MGNQQNSNAHNNNNIKDLRTEKKETTIIDIKSKKFPNEIENLKDSNSSYKGIKTNEVSSDTKTDVSKNETECQTIPENSDFKDLKIHTLFEWKEGGDNVYIVGDFSNWSNWHMMNKTNNKFELNLVKKLKNLLKNF